MDGERKKSTRKGFIGTISKPFRYLSASREASLVDRVDLPSSTPLDATIGLGQQGGTSVSEGTESLEGQSPSTTPSGPPPSVTSATRPAPAIQELSPSTQVTSVSVQGAPGLLSGDEPLDRRSSAPPQPPVHRAVASASVDRPPVSPEGPTNPPPMVSAAPTPTSTSPVAQLTKNIAKATLGLLGAAAEGIPILGVKGIFVTISRAIEAVEVTQTNQEEFKNLEARCKMLMNTVIIPLQAQADVPQTLQSNLVKLDKDLKKMLSDVENQLALGTMSRFINNQDDLALLTKMDNEISYFIEFYSATLLTHVHQTMLNDREKQAIVCGAVHQQTLEYTMPLWKDYGRHIVFHSGHSVIDNPLLLQGTAIVLCSTTIADQSYGSMCRLPACECCKATSRYRGLPSITYVQEVHFRSI